MKDILTKIYESDFKLNAVQNSISKFRYPAYKRACKKVSV